MQLVIQLLQSAEDRDPGLNHQHVNVHGRKPPDRQHVEQPQRLLLLSREAPACTYNGELSQNIAMVVFHCTIITFSYFSETRHGLRTHVPNHGKYRKRNVTTASFSVQRTLRFQTIWAKMRSDSKWIGLLLTCLINT